MCVSVCVCVSVSVSVSVCVCVFVRVVCVCVFLFLCGLGNLTGSLCATLLSCDAFAPMLVLVRLACARGL